MKTKILEVRDSMTYIAMLAVDMNSIDPREAPYLRREGYPNDGRPNILLTRLSGVGEATNDPEAWEGRTLPVAHDYIINHWRELESGSVVDVEFILGETPAPKLSELITVASAFDGPF